MPGTLNQTGTIISFMVTSQTKSNRRRCIKAISENTITAIVVKGFMIRFPLFHKVANIACLFPLTFIEPHSNLEKEAESSVAET